MIDNSGVFTWEVYVRFYIIYKIINKISVFQYGFSLLAVNTTIQTIFISPEQSKLVELPDAIPQPT